MAVDGTGNVRVGGMLKETADSCRDGFAASLEASGATRWAVRVGSKGRACGNVQGLGIDRSGNMFATGWESPSGDFGMYFASLDPSGHFRWRRHPRPSLDGPLMGSYPVAVDAHGHLIVAATQGHPIRIGTKTFDCDVEGGGGTTAVGDADIVLFSIAP